MPRAILFVLLVIGSSQVYGQYFIELPESICKDLREFKEFQYDRSAVKKAEKLLRRGMNAFFKRLDLEEAEDSLEELKELWKSEGASLVYAGLAKRVMRGLIVLARVFHLKKDSEGFLSVVHLLSHDFSSLFERDPFVSPDIAAKFHKPSTVQVEVKNPDSCRSYIDGVPVVRERADVIPGEHNLLVVCNGGSWIRTVKIREGFVLRFSPSLARIFTNSEDCFAKAVTEKEISSICSSARFMEPSMKLCRVNSGKWVWKEGEWVNTERGKRAFSVRRIKHVRVLPIVLSCVGIAALGAGVTFNLLANATTEKINEGKRLIEKRRKYIIGSWAGYATGAVSLITAGVLWGIQGFTYESTVKVLPQPTGISLMGSF